MVLKKKIEFHKIFTSRNFRLPIQLFAYHSVKKIKLLRIATSLAY